MKGILKQQALELGFDDLRVTSAAAPEHADKLRRWIAAGQQGEMAWLARNADKRADPQLVLAEARSIVAVAASYGAENGGAQSDCGVVARYARYRDYHDVMADRLRLLASAIDAAVEGSRSLWYVDTGPLLERELAQRAGIGFVGKHTNLISRSLGNWFFLAEIITTAELERDQPERNRCGTCSRCIAACPTGAITEPFNVDARRCISYLTIELKGAIPAEFRRAIGNRIYGCDDCLAACPWNRFAREGAMMREHARPELAAPNLIELLSLDDEQFKKRFAGTPMLRTKRRGLLRNACVALGNVGDETALPALRIALTDREPLIREHAEWAIREIESRTRPGATRMSDESLAADTDEQPSPPGVQREHGAVGCHGSG